CRTGSAPRTSRMTLHHTAGSRSFDRETSIEKMRAIQSYHMDGRSKQGKEDFKDIGYHFVVDGKGRIAEGRPTDVLGAHAGRANRGNIGISLMGNFNKQQPTKEQLESLTRLAAFLAMKYGIDVTREGKFEGHYRYGNTSCPGKNVIAVLPDLKSRIKGEKEALLRPSARTAEPDKFASFVPVNVVA
ncbi:peptidoglycan recognition family protein, partial [Elusimicrobiota bacterium]